MDKADSPPKPTSPELKPSAPSMMNEERSEEAPMPQEGRQSKTPTGRRVTDQTTGDSAEKPSPAVQGLPETLSTSSSMTQGTMHRRQPAAHSNDDEEDPPPDLSLLHRPSPRRPVTTSFSDDVAGIFDSIGHSDPAKELGLPPDSLRLHEKTNIVSDTKSAKFPADLGRSMSTDSPRKGKERLAAPIPVSQRTSSLPRNGSSSTHSVVSPKLARRTTSSPIPSPRPFNPEEASLVPPPRSHSHASISSSGKQSKDIGLHPTVAIPNLGLPIQVGNSDFGPDMNGSTDTTIKARQTDYSPAPPASVRLVTSPRLNDGGIKGLDMTSDSLAKSTFVESSARDKQSSTPRISHAQGKEVEEVKTPIMPSQDPEDDAEEEKGRRLACEFLDDDFSSVQPDKVAEFLGGP